MISLQRRPVLARDGAWLVGGLLTQESFGTSHDGAHLVCKLVVALITPPSS
jgi:hypothetical protein